MSLLGEPIISFFGEYRWLSNFWPCDIVFDKEHYDSVEAAYVAAKTLDPEIRIAIRQLSTPGKVKRFGRNIELRDDWEPVKISVMRELLQQKFAPGTELSKKLIATGKVPIIEGNTWGDTFWGVCDGKGDNVLGNILEQIRNDLR